MKFQFQFYFFILIFFFTKNEQIKSENGVAKDNLDNITEEESQNEIINLNLGYIQEEFITFGNPKYLSFNDNNLDFLLIHIFSIDCQIEMTADECEDSMLIKEIDNDDHNTFSIKIIKNFTKIGKNHHIKISLRQNNEDIKFNKRKCPLVINSMSNKAYNLTVEEHNPTIFYFDDNLQNINLKCYLSDLLYDNNSYVVFSFLFNEKASFEINIEEDIEYNKIRKISNSYNMFLTKKTFEGKEININMRKIGEEKKPVLLTFRVMSNYYTPFILQKNYLNQGFITSNINYQHYYMEIFKDEEGEIMLHDKRQNGKLIGRICNYTDYNCEIRDNNTFIGTDTKIKLIEYKENIRKLKFNYKDTKNCENGCYLLISYYHDTFDTINNTIIGFEFTLLTRIWDKNDWSKTNIVNIPNNEYIFGYFEKNSINQHYYSILVYNETETELIIEIRGKNFKFFYGEGKIKLNTYNDILDNTKELIIENEMEMLSISNNNYTNYTKLSFAIRPINFLEDKVTSYYFRVFQTKDINDLIIPLDSNIENNYKSLNLFNSDLDISYLLKNDYNEFLLNFKIFISNAIFNNDVDKLFKYESIKNKNLDMSDETLTKIKNEKNEMRFDGSVKKMIDNLQNYNLNFILFKFEIRFQTEETFLSFSDSKNEEIFLQVYSPQIFNIRNNDSFIFSFLSNYYYSLKWINGKGEMKDSNSTFASKMDKNDEGKYYYSSSLSNIEQKITFINTEDFCLYSKLNYNFESDFIIEIKSGELISEIFNEKNFPIYFFYKLNQSTSYEINFRIINNNNFLANYSIGGMFVDIEKIKAIKRGEYLEFKNEIEAKYDSYSYNGLLEIYEDYITKDNDYIVIKIEQLNEKFSNNVLIQIISLEVIDQWIYYDFPVNQFVVGSIDSNNTDIDFKLIDILNENSKGEKLLVEFNKNIKEIELEYISDEGECIKICNEGIEKYIVTNNLSQENTFLINYDKENAPKDLLSGNYIIRYYYLTDRFIDVDYIFSKKFSIEENETKQDNNITRILLNFENLKIYNNSFINNDNIYSINNENNESKIEIEEKVDYTIYLNLYSNENITELLNTTAIIYTKPIIQNIVFSSNKDTNFSLNITINSTNIFNYNYTMQIKFSINSPLLNYEMLAYTVDMDLKDFLKYNQLKNEDDDDNNKKLVIALFSTISVLIIIVIIVLIYIFKMKKKNKELKDKVLSISFAEGKSDSLLTEDSSHSKKDEEYESIFI